MPPKSKEYVIDIKDEAHFAQFINSENKKLVLIDLYPKWSGACNLMQATYKELSMSIEDFDRRVDILNVELERIQQFKHEKINRESSSKPHFVFLIEGKVIDEVIGADSPSISEKVIKYIPMVY